MAFGSYEHIAKPTKNPDVKMQNNIVAGCVYAGYVAPSFLDCGGDDSKFKNKVAHSINGTGLYAYADPVGTNHLQCVEWGHFTGYKTQISCAVSFL